MNPSKPFIHSLTIMKSPKGHGWISPAEADANAPRDISFVAPVNSDGRLHDVYALEVFKYGLDGKHLSLENHYAYLTEARTLKVLINDHVLVFRENRSNTRLRSFPYLGKFKNSDFQYRLVELVPDPFELVDELFLASGLVLIGCDPASHYQGWMDEAKSDVLEVSRESSAKENRSW